MFIEERSLILWTLPVKQQQRRVQMRTQLTLMVFIRIRMMMMMMMKRRRISVSCVVMKDSCQSSSLQLSGL